jgi:hypothetical protein
MVEVRGSCGENSEAHYKQAADLLAQAAKAAPIERSALENRPPSARARREIDYLRAQRSPLASAAKRYCGAIFSYGLERRFAATQRYFWCRPSRRFLGSSFG